MFEKIVGHQTITNHLEKEIAGGAVGHAYLFSGMDGIGKKKAAKEFAKALLCLDTEKKPCGHCPVCIQIDHENHPDVNVITPKTGEVSIKINQIREMISDLSVKPYSGNWRIVIIDGAETMTPEAQNSLLKSLEEPLSYNIFILLTSHPQSLLPTIRSRCQSYHFQPLASEEIEKIFQQETEFDEQAISEAALSAGGSPGMAYYLLTNREIREERIHYLREIYSLLRGNEIKVFSLAEALSKDKITSQGILEFLINWFYEVGLLLEGHPLPGEAKPNKIQIEFHKILQNEKNIAIIKTLFEMMATIQYNVNLRLQWEKCFIKIMKIQKG
ncbi:DNA polymerase III subunit delta' [Acetobacterium tundrae]|uniref:DNA polymerase III subunit delta n=1 Tax=Acetobacterium tundrae TaxID=132932 RepID=A0ABR6WN59_9FIRM|nr:DNA polymerase III subunit delta' [Acetobacterium tundrae]MBC3797728.1 DNA polymerase III subunit delta' [Acetobacterium tundrae]